MGHLTSVVVCLLADVECNIMACCRMCAAAIIGYNRQKLHCLILLSLL